MQLKIYTDGSANIHDGSGAWAFCVVECTTAEDEGEMMFSSSGYADDTTNNRMEMQAVLEALRWIASTGRMNEALMIISDSAYVVNCFRSRWYVKWRRNGWYGSCGPVKNRDLWEQMLELYESMLMIPFYHIRGHQGNKWNEWCDKECDRVRRAGVAAKAKVEDPEATE